MVSAFESDIGRIRGENQDFCCSFSLKDALFGVVADGMGGANGGAVASKIAVEAVQKTIEQNYDESMSAGALVELCNTCLRVANADVLRYASKNASLEGMGTTMVLAAVRKERAVILNVGDSRAYFVFDNELKQITKDQSYVQHLIDTGKISEAEAKNHPKKNVIMQALGASQAVLPDVYELSYSGETLLLCSDGLYNKVCDKDIIKAVNDKSLSPKERVKKLIHMANDAGGEDNISAVLIMCD